MAKKFYWWLALILIIAAAVIWVIWPSAANQSLTQTLQNLRTLVTNPNTLPGSTSSGGLFTASQPLARTDNVEGTLSSFGDNFSGVGYINQSQTDMFLDYNETALTFPPLYNFKKEAVAHSTAPDQAPLCLGQKPQQLCLTVQANKLYINGAPVTWPAELGREHILNVTIQTLQNIQETRWIVGVVTGQNHDQRGWVYFFNGHNFTPLITATTAQQITPRYGHTGGRIYFGGDLDDFLILYSGYDGHAFYDHLGSLSDVSRFFGLRVMGGGFAARIIKTTNARGSIFYICSQGSPNFQLIKLWSLRPGNLMGAVDFSFLIYKPASHTAGCSLDPSSVTATSTNFQPKLYLGFTQATSSETWSFVDKGFDNTQNRQVTSKDLGLGRGRQITGAIINQFAAYTNVASSSGTTYSSPWLKLFLANNQVDWQAVQPYLWYKFNDPNTSLYWRAIFQPQSNDPSYSPWFDNINELLYKILD